MKRVRQKAKARAAQKHASSLGRGSFGTSAPKAVGPATAPKAPTTKPLKPFHKG